MPSLSPVVHVAVECAGTFFLCFTIATSVGWTHLAYYGYTLPVSSTLIHLAIGGSLVAAVYAGGPLSGGHFNPAVSVAAALRGSLGVATCAAHVGAQLVGSLAAYAAASVLAESDARGWTPGFPQVHASQRAAFVAECVFAFALCHVVLHTTTARSAANNSYFGLAIGLTVTSALLAIGSVSGGSINPATGVLSLLGGVDLSTAWVYFVAPFFGGALAAALFNFTHPHEKGTEPAEPKPPLADYVIEFVGTFLLVFTVATAASPGNKSGLAPLSIGSMLVAQVYAGGPTSGGHYNPAVTLGVLVRGSRDLSPFKAATYVSVQCLAAVTASVVASWGLPGVAVAEPALGEDVITGAAWLAEFVGTFILTSVVLQVATNPDAKGNSYFGLAIGFTVFSLAVALSAVSGGVFNPAVALLSRSSAALFVYFTACPAGGLLAGYAYCHVCPSGDDLAASPEEAPRRATRLRTDAQGPARAPVALAVAGLLALLVAVFMNPHEVASPPPPPVDFAARVQLSTPRVEDPLGVAVSEEQWSASSMNQFCQRGEPAPDDPKMACPAQCEVAHVEQGRVRRAVHTLSEAEWQRVADAMRVIATVPTADGVALYGPGYRDMDFHAFLHVWSQLANHIQEVPTHESERKPIEDATGGNGAPQQEMWHTLEILTYEDTLLLVDPEIGGLPYIDWRHMDLAAYDRYFGQLRMTPLEEFSAEAKSWGEKSYHDLFVLGPDATPFENWPLRLTPWVDWFSKQPPEVREFFSEVDEWYLNAELWKDNWDPPPTGEMLLLGGTAEGSDGPQDFHGIAHRTAAPVSKSFTYGLWNPLPGFVPGVLRAAPEWFDSILGGLNFTRLIGLCTSNTIGLHNEFAACINGFLQTERAVPFVQDQPIHTMATPNMHQAMHTAVGGDMNTGSSALYDPIFMLHHAGVDWLRRTWQSNNADLRPWAYGYPAKSGYTRLPIDLYDCVGCAAYGLGFDETRLDELGRFKGHATTADVLCGEVDKMYTYDTLLAAQEEKQRASAHAASMRVGSSLLALLGTALILSAMCWLVRAPPEAQLIAVASGDEHASYEMKHNPTAQLKAAGP